MKLLHITNELSEGGVASFLMSLLPAFVKAGHSVDLLSLTEPQDEYAHTLQAQGINVLTSKSASARNPRNIALIRSALCRNNYDIVHTHLFPAQYYAIIAKLLSHTTARFVTTEHNGCNKRRSIKALRSVERFIYGQYHAVAGVSHTAAAALKEWLGENIATHITAINNGIDLHKFSAAQPYSNEELGLPANARIAVMTARFYAIKNHQCLVRAAPLLPNDVHILFVGSGELENECKLLAQQLGVSDRVHFLGNRSDVPRLLRSSDIGILSSSSSEGFGLCLAEYMAAGLPVVATDISVLREVVQDCGILFPQNDHAALATAINRLLAAGDYYQQTAQRSVLRAQNFSQQRMAQEYLTVYESLV